MTEPVSTYQQAFINNDRRRRRLVAFCQILILVLFVSLWEGTTRLGILNDFIFSSPSRIVKTFVTMAGDGTVFYHIGISSILEPYLITLNSLPKTALAPIFIVWLGNNMKTIIVCAISLAIFGTVINLTTSFTQMDPDKLLLIKTLGGSRKDMLSKVIIPGSVPNIISNMKVNIGLCLVGVIIGEFLSANAGLGYLIVYGSQVFKLDWVLMSIVILCIIATALYALLNLIEKVYLKRHTQ